jgi:hypothetical protein
MFDTIFNKSNVLDLDSKVKEFVDIYYAYVSSMSKYGIINSKIKDFLREHNKSYKINDYVLKLKEKDVSIFDNELVDYMIDNQLNQFLEEVIDESKISKLIDSKKINRESILPFVIKEKTHIDISMDGKYDIIESYKARYEEFIKDFDLIAQIRERRKISLEIDEIKNSYYSMAKWLKWYLAENNMDEYKFDYNGYNGLIKVVVKERIYDTKNFIKWIHSNNIDATTVQINSAKLLKSKSKKINWEYVNVFKDEKIDETVWITEVKGTPCVKNSF